MRVRGCVRPITLASGAGRRACGCMAPVELRDRLDARRASALQIATCERKFRRAGGCKRRSQIMRDHSRRNLSQENSSENLSQDFLSEGPRFHEILHWEDL